jgi:hypothetical protein
MKNKHSPRLVLVGGAIATVGMLSGCNNSQSPTLDVMRNGYSSQQECLQDWGDPKDCQQIGGGAGASGASGASGSSGGHAYGAHWYGPYYTKKGVVYHGDGSTSQRVAPPTPRVGSTTTEMPVEERELRSGSSAFSRSPSSEMAHEGPVVSRGGFFRGIGEAFHGGRGFGGFHGGG